MGVTIHGLDDLERTLTRDIPAAVDAALEDTATAAMVPMLERAGQLAPRGDDADGLVLAESMVHETVETAPGVAVAHGGPERKIFYAHMVEFGTEHSAPHPFLRPGFEEGRADAVAAALAEVAEAVEGAL